MMTYPRQRPIINLSPFLAPGGSTLLDIVGLIRMARTTRKLEELQESSNHLFYEVWMFTSLANGLASGIAGQGPIANALLESFVIHVRAIMDFLYAERPQADDVIAEDFFASPEQWTKIRPALSEILSQAKRRAGKEVAHLTCARLDVTPETKPWRFIEIANEVMTVMDTFLKKRAKRKTRFKVENRAA